MVLLPISSLSRTQIKAAISIIETAAETQFPTAAFPNSVPSKEHVIAMAPCPIPIWCLSAPREQGGKHHAAERTGAPVPALPTAGDMALGKSLNFSAPSFLCL